MERQKDEQTLSELSSHIVTMMTTEHYNLQSGRSMTVADTNGRCTLFIGTVSGALIAIAFAGQASGMGTAFFVFSLVLFPSLFVMGLFTFERVLQAGIEDLIYARGITRLHQQYACGGLCWPAACRDHLALAGLYECRSRDIPGELWNTSTLSMAALEAS